MESCLTTFDCMTCKAKTLGRSFCAYSKVCMRLYTPEYVTPIRAAFRLGKKKKKV